MIRAFATGVFQAVYVYTPEVYATNIRASALGVHSAAARIGALLTPFNAQVRTYVHICTGFCSICHSNTANVYMCICFMSSMSFYFFLMCDISIFHESRVT